jgi:uncharacterized membrane protein
VQKLLLFGVLLILVGFGLLFAGTVSTGSASVGGVVFVGPVPIVFGAGPGGWELALGAAVVGAIMVAMLFLWGRRMMKPEDETG